MASQCVNVDGTAIITITLDPERKRSRQSIMAKQVPINVSVLILGESHCTAISRAIRDDLQDKFIGVDVRKGAGSSKINFDLFSNILPKKLVLTFGGTEHNILGLIEADPRFDFMWPPYDDFAPDRALIPACAIEELIRNRLHTSVQRALTVRDHFDCPAFALAPPPPFRAVDEKTKLPSAFDNLLEVGVTPATVRRKLYAVQCEVMYQAYAKSGIPFIAAPRAAQDEEGYLIRKLWNRDPTHGNPHYGRLVLDHLRKELHV
jgi:hypothetical protein